MGRPRGSKNKAKDVSSCETVLQKRVRQPSAKVRESQQQQSEEIDEENTPSMGSGSLRWDDNPAWTFKIIEYLTDNPDFRRKLFSDSTREAKGERRKKQQGKDQKVQMHATLAAYVFENHPDYSVDFKEDKTKFVRSVGQRLQR